MRSVANAVGTKTVPTITNLPKIKKTFTVNKFTFLTIRKASCSSSNKPVCSKSKGKMNCTAHAHQWRTHPEPAISFITNHRTQQQLMAVMEDM